MVCGLLRPALVLLLLCAVQAVPGAPGAADPKEAMKKMKETLESIDLQPLQKAHPKPKLDKIELGGKSSKRDSSKPLEYTLEEFTEVYAANRHGIIPDTIPKHDPEHEEFDPFEVPMPTLKTEYTPEAAFAKMDEDGNGKIAGSEFRGIAESGMFNVLANDDFKKYAIFGMGKDLWLKLHQDEVEAAGLLPEDLFNTHDADANERLTREEYEAAVGAFRGEL